MRVKISSCKILSRSVNRLGDFNKEAEKKIIPLQ